MPTSEDSKELDFAGGQVSSSEIPGLQHIPTEALIRLAERFDKGIERKGIDKAWNALSKNQNVLVDKAFILHRIGHVIIHACRLRDKIIAETPMDGDDDAGAIIWAGAFLCCATKALENKRKNELPNCSACGGNGFMAGSSSGPRCPACHSTRKTGQ